MTTPLEVREADPTLTRTLQTRAPPFHRSFVGEDRPELPLPLAVPVPSRGRGERDGGWRMGKGRAAEGGEGQKVRETEDWGASVLAAMRGI